MVLSIKLSLFLPWINKKSSYQKYSNSVSVKKKSRRKTKVRLSRNKFFGTNYNSAHTLSRPKSGSNKKSSFSRQNKYSTNHTQKDNSLINLNYIDRNSSIASIISAHPETCVTTNIPNPYYGNDELNLIFNDRKAYKSVKSEYSKHTSRSQKPVYGHLYKFIYRKLIQVPKSL